MPSFQCVNCQQRLESDVLDVSCKNCGSALLLNPVPTPRVDRASLERLPAGVWRYRALLPAPVTEGIVTLGEGGTPLLSASRLGKELSLDRLFIKDETRNPTGSFIDRGSTVLVSLARERGVETCSCITTGNLGASLAAYCAKAGIAARIGIHANADRGKLYQMIAYGAQVELPSKALNSGSDRRALLVTAGNPYILEGEKTTCFEIAQDMGWRVPDAIVVPVGTGGHLSMIWRAMLQLRESGLIENSSCRLIGVQFEGSAPVVGGHSSRKGAGPTGEPFTELDGSEPILMNEAARAIKGSRGGGVEATPAETIKATSLLARTEGIFAEPASASVVASLKLAMSRGLIDRDETVVCVITGAGLKDTKAISKIAKATRQVVANGDYQIAPMQIGETKLELLHSLANGQRFGYELWKILSEEKKLTTASVYQHLSELEGFGLIRRSGVKQVKGRERVLYELTRKGSDFMKIAGRIERTSLA